MSNQPRNRQELYDRIRETSRDEVILEEMIRLGFWPLEGVLPEDPADEIRRRAALETQLRDLRTQNRQLHNIDALRKEARKRRMAESRKRQQETKERKEKKRQENAEAWQHTQAHEIGYLGKGVSGGLSNTTSDEKKLNALALPLLHTPLDLAQAMGLTTTRLRFLAFTRTTSSVSHYVQFYIPKKSGGKRLISAPLKRLKAAQYWILKHILEPQVIHDAAHGFVPKRSIVTNATPHVNADVVVNMDLKDFFPTVSYKRVKGLFMSMGYSEALATILGLICTEPRSRQVLMDGQTYHVAIEKRVLPQGAPTSPAITNLICRGLDARLSKAARTLSMTYTRYADDLSFSGDRDADIGKLLRRVKYIIMTEGFEIHPRKLRIFRKPKRQEVTGIVVNDHPSLNRATLKRFRAVLFQIEKDGPQGKHWNGSGDTIAAVQGFADYIAMVNPQKGVPFQIRARELVKRYGKKPSPKPLSKQPKPSDTPSTTPTTEKAAAPAKKKPWWRIW